MDSSTRATRYRILNRIFPLQVVSTLVSYNLSALSLRRPVPLPLRVLLLQLALHGVGLMLVAQLARVPLWIAGAGVALLLLAQRLPRIRALLSPALLAPFWVVYLAVALRFVWLRFLAGEIPGYFEYTLPDPRVLFHFEFLLTTALLYCALIFLACVLNARGRAVAIVALVCGGLSVVWAVAEYFGHRTFGATGSDPFAYVQMGVDLVRHGVFSHSFPLFSLVSSSSLPWFPILHVGYRLPFDVSGDAITVWSPGGAVAYALAYRLAGEPALYLVNPFFSLLSVLVTGLLAWELTRAERQVLRVAVTGLTVLILATSNEIVDWAGVTMADTQALVFSGLAFYSALRLFRTGRWSWAVGTGLCWGIAYLVRHTQLVIILGMLPLLLGYAAPRREILRNVAIVGVTAFLVALPDLWYHEIYLGHWLRPESEELALFSWQAIPGVLAAIGQRALTGAEFGWLALFVSAGLLLYTRRENIPGLALLLWLGVTLAVHVPYAALRLRDLIPQFPVLAFYAGFGIVASLDALSSAGRLRTFLAAVLLFLALEFSLVRVWNTLPRPMREPRARFGAMTSAQRAAFDVLAQLTPDSAVIGASLNSGAVELYANRATFRPADWSAAELRQFLAVTQGENLPVYLLQDNVSLSGVLNDLRASYRVERVTTLDVPLFGDAPVREAGALWKITP